MATVAFACPSALGVEAAHPAKLRCEYLENPQGIDVVQPVYERGGT